MLCVQSLSGHTTTVEAVRFGHAEEMVVAGSQSGALKVWDLEQAKSKSRDADPDGGKTPQSAACLGDVDSATCV